jgi:hypothetical protein
MATVVISLRDHFINVVILLVSLRTRSVIYPPPRVVANELIKRPHFLVQVAIIQAPRVGLS